MIERSFLGGEGVYLSSGPGIFRSHKSQGPTELATRVWGLKPKYEGASVCLACAYRVGNQALSHLGDLIMAENTNCASPGMMKCGEGLQ